MARRISMGARREVVLAVAERYRGVGRHEKGRILDELLAEFRLYQTGLFAEVIKIIDEFLTQRTSRHPLSEVPRPPADHLSTISPSSGSPPPGYYIWREENFSPSGKGYYQLASSRLCILVATVAARAHCRSRARGSSCSEIGHRRLGRSVLLSRTIPQARGLSHETARVHLLAGRLGCGVAAGGTGAAGRPRAARRRAHDGRRE
jgi:hypothetical protein